MGNQQSFPWRPPFRQRAFKAAGATFVAQSETARIMAKVQPKEMARRGNFFKSRGYDPAEVSLVLPDVTFDSEMTIRLGGREARLAYLGPGQQAGDTFVFSPTPAWCSPPACSVRGACRTWLSHRRWKIGSSCSISLRPWMSTRSLPAHGDVSTGKDVKELSAMLADEYATVKDAVAKGVSLDEALRTLKFPQYKDWRNYGRLEGEIRALYELIGTGKRSYFD